MVRAIRAASLAAAAVLVGLSLASCTAPQSPKLGPSRVSTSSSVLDVSLDVTPTQAARGATFTAQVSARSREKEVFLHMVFPDVTVSDAQGIAVYDWEYALTHQRGMLLRGYQGFELGPGQARSQVSTFAVSAPGLYTVIGRARANGVDATTPVVVIEVR